MKIDRITDDDLRKLVKQGRKFMEISSLSPLINSLYDSFNRRYITIYGPQKLQIRQEEIRSLLD